MAWEQEFTRDSSHIYQKGFETKLQELVQMTNTKSGAKTDEKIDKLTMIALETLGVHALNKTECTMTKMYLQTKPSFGITRSIPI